MEARKRLEKIQYENARAEELLFAYAKENHLCEFKDKWDEKLYNDDDYTIHHMVSDFLNSLEKKKENEKLLICNDGA